MTRQLTLSMQQDVERLLHRLLPNSFADSQQLAVDRYHIDFTHRSVAVEVHSASWYPFVSSQLASRAVDLAERGWNLIYVWSHGANFDEPLWTAAAAAVGQGVPWKFWNVRCTRTAFDLRNFDPKSIAREGTHHNALDDAKHQARCVQAAMKHRDVAA